MDAERTGPQGNHGVTREPRLTRAVTQEERRDARTRLAQDAQHTVLVHVGNEELRAADAVLAHHRVWQAGALMQLLRPLRLGRLGANRQASRAPALVIAVPRRELGETQELIVNERLELRPLAQQGGVGQEPALRVVQDRERRRIARPDPRPHGRNVHRGHEHLALGVELQGVHDRSAGLLPCEHELELRACEVVKVTEAEYNRIAHVTGQIVQGHSFHEGVETGRSNPPEEIRVPRVGRVGRVPTQLPIPVAARLDLLVDVGERAVKDDPRVHATLAQCRNERGLLEHVLGPLPRGQHDVGPTAQVRHELVERAAREIVPPVHDVGHTVAGGRALQFGHDRAVGAVGIAHHHHVRPDDVHAPIAHDGWNPLRTLVVEERGQLGVLAEELGRRVVQEEHGVAQSNELVPEVHGQLEAAVPGQPGNPLVTLVADAARIHDSELIAERNRLTDARAHLRTERIELLEPVEELEGCVAGEQDEVGERGCPTRDARPMLLFQHADCAILDVHPLHYLPAEAEHGVLLLQPVADGRVAWHRLHGEHRTPLLTTAHVGHLHVGDDVVGPGRHQRVRRTVLPIHHDHAVRVERARVDLLGHTERVEPRNCGLRARRRAACEHILAPARSAGLPGHHISETMPAAELCQRILPLDRLFRVFLLDVHVSTTSC